MNSLSNFQIPDVWEVKDVINKMKNVVLNYTEMEAKVHEATSADPWGASSTLMLEIAQGTYNYQYFNEIMPTIYKRFTEKDAKQWRQIYKALVLLEYLIKNGSERVIDDARSHVSVIKIMRNFYYIDEKGKDEGINVRNRAQEIVDLLSNTEKIRTERKLAKKNRTKYIGVSSESSRYASGSGMGSGSGASRYFGFGSDSSNGISFNGDAMTIGTPYAAQRSKYDDDDDDNDNYGGFRDNNDSNDSLHDKDHSFTEETKKNNDDDDDWGDFTWGGADTDAKPNNNNTGNILDDDFADFQQADDFTNNTTASTTVAKPTNNNDLFDLLGESSAAPISPSLQFQPVSQPMTPMSQASSLPQQQQQQQQQQKVAESPKPAESQNAINTGMWAQASNFVSLDGLGKSTNTNQPKTGPSMNTLKSTSVAADWNKWATNNNHSNNSSNNTTPAPKTSNAFDDLLSL